jgi:hypothetical protein
VPIVSTTGERSGSPSAGAEAITAATITLRGPPDQIRALGLIPAARLGRGLPAVDPAVWTRAYLLLGRVAKADALDSWFGAHFVQP